VAVVGSSGSGKSSLVRAGLLPSLYGGLLRSAGSGWRVAVCRPGGDPMGNLARALNEPGVLRDQEPDPMVVTVTEAMLRRGALGLIEIVAEARLPGRENLLVVVDQFEEIFRFRRTSEYGDEAAAFVKLLLEATSQRDVPVYVIITMRSDYLGDCSQFRDLPETINRGQYLIPRMTRDERKLAITGPVAVGGGEITPRLVNRLLNDVGDNPDQLPILQHALMRTWDYWTQHAASGEPLDLQHYEATGGMAEALSRHADEAYAELGDDRGKLIAEKLFRRLTERGQDNRETRRPTTLAELCAVAEAPEAEVVRTIDTFRGQGRAFLMPPDHTRLAPESIIDISHESLIRGWTRLRGWVEAEAESARMYRRLSETATLHRAGQAGLWHDPDLQLWLEWWKRTGPTAAWARTYDANFEAAAEFLEKSRVARDEEVAERERQRRRQLTRTRVFLGLVAAGLVVALWQGAAARRAARIATSRALAFHSIRALRQDPELGQLLALQAAAEVYNKDRTIPAEAEDALHQALAAPYLKLRLKVPIEQVNALAFSPDGGLLAAACRDSTVILWDIASGKVTLTLKDSGNLTKVLFSPDGSRLATINFDGNTVLWSVADGHKLFTLPGQAGDDEYGLAFSPDGSRLATASGNHVLQIWDSTGKSVVKTGRLPGAIYDLAYRPDGHALVAAIGDTLNAWELPSGKHLWSWQTPDGSNIYSLAFSADGRRIAASGNSSVIKVVDAQTGLLLTTLRGHTNSIGSLAYSRDGSKLASGSYDRSVIVWDKEGRVLNRLTGHSGWVLAVAFSPDGELLASAGGDSVVRVWDVGAGLEILNLPVAAFRVAFSPDGRRIATGGTTAQVLDGRTGQGLVTLFGHTQSVEAVGYSPDGKRLATGSKDSTTVIWDALTGRRILTLKGHRGTVYALTFSPDGKRILTGSGDSTAVIWDTDSGRPQVTLKGHTDVVWAVAFSPDGKYVATGGRDNVARIWTADSGRLLQTLQMRNWVNATAFSPDGGRLVTGSRDGLVVIWNRASGKPLLRLSGHTGGLQTLIFSPDGTRLASVAIDSTTRVWDASSGRELFTLSGSSPPNGVSFSPDGLRLASSFDGMIKVYAMSGEELMHLAWMRVTRPLSEEECHRYPHTAPCPSPASSLVVEAKALARSGDVSGAVADLEQAKRLDPTVQLYPAIEAGHLAAETALRKGGAWAATDLDSALVSFRRAIQLDSSRETKVHVAERVIQGATVMARAGKIGQAVAGYKAALEFDPELRVSPSDLNSLCWWGSLYGQAADVLDACEKAVALYPENWQIRDSRGLARALTGHTDGAIEDFRVFVDSMQDVARRAERQRYVDALRAGRNPFTPEELARLRLE
jgi:WD40 repeat protein